MIGVFLLYLFQMDPRRKEWIIKSARSDYHELVRLLREEPKLAHVKVKTLIISIDEYFILCLFTKCH